MVGVADKAVFVGVQVGKDRLTCVELAISSTGGSVHCTNRQAKPITNKKNRCFANLLKYILPLAIDK